MTSVVVPTIPTPLDVGLTSTVTVAVPGNGRLVWLGPKGVRVLPGQTVTVPSYRSERVVAMAPDGATVVDVTLAGGVPVPDRQPAGPLVVRFDVDSRGLFRSEGDASRRAAWKSVPCWLDEAMTQPATFPLDTTPLTGVQLWVAEPGSYELGAYEQLPGGGTVTPPNGQQALVVDFRRGSQTEASWR